MFFLFLVFFGGGCAFCGGGFAGFFLYQNNKEETLLLLFDVYINRFAIVNSSIYGFRPECLSLYQLVCDGLFYLFSF